MKIQATIAEQATRLRLSGRFDAHECDQFRAALAEHDQARVVELDLAEVVFLDSSALAELVRARQEFTAAGRELVLSPVSDPVRVILELTQLAGFLGLADVDDSATGTPR